MGIKRFILKKVNGLRARTAPPKQPGDVSFHFSPPKVAMDCISNNSIYLRSNGDLVCWCDAGVGKTLRSFDENLDYGKDVYLGPVYNFIRKKLYANEMPFPDFCKRCLMLKDNAEISSHYLDNKIIQIFQVEPTIRCGLECPGCLTQERRRELPEPHVLDMRVFEKILNDFKRNGIKIGMLDFTGHGEPLLNKDIWNMVKAARDRFPTTYIRIGTNCNASFNEKYIDSGVSDIMCAIDGVDQETYGKYRINGKFDRAYNFMKKFSILSKQRKKDIKVIWKYVLFEHNDSIDNLVKAQELATEAMVDELRFVNTQLGPNSSRNFDNSVVPLINDSLFVNFTGYGPSVEKLGEKVAEACNVIDRDYAKAVTLLDTVVENISRFLKHKNSVTDKYRELFKSLVPALEQLNRDDRKQLHSKIAHLL